VFLKPEMLQRTGSFKFRGAFNKLSVDPDNRARRRRGGVLVRQSRPGRGLRGADPQHAGDHRDAGRRAALQARAHQGLCAEVVLYDRDREDREAIAGDIAGRRGATLVRPYDDPLVIAGQGTVGREIAEDMAALGLAPDIVVAPASGGGLVAGTATAIKARYPRAEVMSAEPEPSTTMRARFARESARRTAPRAAPSATR